MMVRSFLLRSLTALTVLAAADVALGQSATPSSPSPAAPAGATGSSTAAQPKVTAEDVKAFLDNPQSLLTKFEGDAKGLEAQVRAILEFAAASNQLDSVLSAMQTAAAANGVSPTQVQAMTRGADAAAQSLAGTPSQLAIQTAVQTSTPMSLAQTTMANTGPASTRTADITPVQPTVNPAGQIGAGVAPANTTSTTSTSPAAQSAGNAGGVASNSGTLQGATGGGSGSTDNDDDDDNADTSPVSRT